MNLYHLFIIRRPGVTQQTVENLLGAAASWIRYHETCYVIETSESAETWKERLTEVFRPEGYIFICKLDKRDYEGWMQKNFWEWFQARLS